jgi:hypothetical protein
MRVLCTLFDCIPHLFENPHTTFHPSIHPLNTNYHHRPRYAYPQVYYIKILFTQYQLYGLENVENGNLFLVERYKLRKIKKNMYSR